MTGLRLLTILILVYQSPTSSLEEDFFNIRYWTRESLWFRIQYPGKSNFDDCLAKYRAEWRDRSYGFTILSDSQKCAILELMGTETRPEFTEADPQKIYLQEHRDFGPEPTKLAIFGVDGGRQDLGKTLLWRRVTPSAMPISGEKNIGFYWNYQFVICDRKTKDCYSTYVGTVNSPVLNTIPPMPHIHRKGSVTHMTRGRVWVTGGGKTGETHRFGSLFQNGQWSDGPHLPPDHDDYYDHCVAMATDDVAILMGGYSDSYGGLMDKAYKYDWSSSSPSWQEIAPAPNPVRFGMCTNYINNRAIFFGGKLQDESLYQGTQKYFLDDNSWEITQDGDFHSWELPEEAGIVSGSSLFIWGMPHLIGGQKSNGNLSSIGYRFESGVIWRSFASTIESSNPVLIPYNAVGRRGP